MKTEKQLLDESVLIYPFDQTDIQHLIGDDYRDDYPPLFAQSRASFLAQSRASFLAEKGIEFKRALGLAGIFRDTDNPADDGFLMMGSFRPDEALEPCSKN